MKPRPNAILHNARDHDTAPIDNISPLQTSSIWSFPQKGCTRLEAGLSKLRPAWLPIISSTISLTLCTAYRRTAQKSKVVSIAVCSGCIPGSGSQKCEACTNRKAQCQLELAGRL